MFQNLQDRLDKALKSLKGEGRITELNVAQTTKEIRRALISADVSYNVAKDITSNIREKAIGQNVLTTVSPGQLFTKIVRDELATLMGGAKEDLNTSGKPSIYLIAGLQGSGKTTFSGKLSLYLKKQKAKKPLLIACDIYRPAAINQLKVLAEQIDVPVYAELDNKNPIEIAQNGIKNAEELGCDSVIIDTAGRLAVNQEMMKEISGIHQEINPTETLFVVDSMTGQDAVNTAKAFNDVLNYDGVILTKLDGDTRGGAALTIRSVVDKPIKFVSSGEKMESLDVFYPDRMAERILGMGDVVSLVEKAQQHFDEKEARKLNKKIAKNQFGFDDFIQQIHQIKKMGDLKDLMAMIPGVGKAVKDLDIDDDSFKHIEAIIQSMTQKERRNPKIIDGSRRKRIAKGSGRDVKEVNQLMKQFSQMSKMMKMMQGSGGKKMMEAMSGIKGFPK